MHGKDGGVENINTVYICWMHMRDPETGAVRFDKRSK